MLQLVPFSAQRLLFFVSVVFCPILNGRAETPSEYLMIQSENWQEELKQIDKEIEQLTDLKNRYKASAASHEDEANRWQFEQNLKQEARRAYQQAELDRQMEQQIQVRIDELEARRATLRKEHPGGTGS